MIPLHYKLYYQNRQWLCENESHRFVADELEDIDQQIKQYLVNTYRQGTFNIKLHFDFNAFPLWMRQYMPHYFNRQIIIKI